MQDEDDEDEEEEESEEEDLGPREMPNRTTRGRRMGQVFFHGLRSELHVYRGLGQEISRNAAQTIKMLRRPSAQRDFSSLI